MPNDNMQYHMRIREFKMNEMQNKIGEQTRIKELRDDPIAAAHSTRYQSMLNRMKQFQKNVEYIQGEYAAAETHMKESVDILQRIRELSVQGSHGTFTKDDLRMMGEEVNQLLNQLVEVANAKSQDGTTLFAGDRIKTPAFRAIEGYVPGANGDVITQVEYQGTIAEGKAEITDGLYMPLKFPGNQVFWAENQQIYSNTEASGYIAQTDASILIDGVEIRIRAGDNVYAVMSKINDSNAPVRARLDPVKNSLVLETTTPHQLMLEDGPTGTVLQDLGILQGGEGGRPPKNIADSARVFGGSIFDMVMSVRDAMFKGDHVQIGGAGIKGIDMALDNLLGSVADLGAKDARLDYTYKRLITEIPDVTARNSKETDLDLADAITELKMLEYTHKASLQTAGRILPPTLLDFLR